MSYSSNYELSSSGVIMHIILLLISLLMEKKNSTLLPESEIPMQSWMCEIILAIFPFGNYLAK